MASVEKIRIFRLKFRGPVHFGRSTVGDDPKPVAFRSDSLWSAIICAAAKLRMADQLLGDVPTGGRSPFTITSAFPYIQEQDQTIYFFPRPLGPCPFRCLERKDTEAREIEKRLRRTDLITQQLFENWICAGDPGLDAITAQLDLSSRLTSMIVTEDFPNVALGCLATASQIYYTSRTFFDGECYRGHAGLWFGAKFEEPEVESLLKAALSVLADDGLGGKRSTGSGVFSWGEDVIHLKTPTDADHFVLLSLLSPALEDRQTDVASLSRGYYRLCKRGGWFMHSNLQGRRKETWMLSEGSVMPAGLDGTVRDVAPDVYGGTCRIFRYGEGFWIRTKVVNNGYEDDL